MSEHKFQSGSGFNAWDFTGAVSATTGGPTSYAHLFHYLASIFIVFNAINQNVNHFSLSFSLFFFKLITITQISSADMTEICLSRHRVGFQK